MEYLELPPTPALAHVVRTYWWLRGDPSGEAESMEAPEPALPDGSPELILNLGDAWEHAEPGTRARRQPLSFLVGQITRPMAVRPTGRVSLVAVRFEAHGATCITPQVGAIVDAWMPVPAGHPLGVRRLRQRLAGAGNPEAQRGVLDEALTALLRSAPPVDAAVGDAVRRIRASFGAEEVDAVARAVGLTPRTLQRRFARVVGITPKTLARIVRFQRVFAAWRESPESLSRVAVACGYFDQSHLVRDFRDFAGAPPAGFLAALPAFTEFFTAAEARRAGR